MALADEINNKIKDAMKAREQDRLAALRAIKSALLLAATEKGGGEVDEQAEQKILAKLAKQRKESAKIYHEQGRPELAEEEETQLAVIEEFLPEQMGEDEIRSKLQEVIANVGADGPSDMGKVMGAAMKELGGSADGGTISRLVKELLG